MRGLSCGLRSPRLPHIRGALCASALAVLSGLGAIHPIAQAPQRDPQQQPPTFRTGANLVRVDVTVLDRRGAPVPSLAAADFELQEDGVRQTIQSFKFVEVSGRQDAGDDSSLPIRSPEHAAAEAARDDVRVFLIFWDEYHIEQLLSATRAREALTKFVMTAFAPKDLVALMDPLTPVDAIRFTRDRRELADAIHKLKGRLGIFIPTRSAAEDEQLRRGDVRRLRAQVTLSALKAAAVHLGAIREGRKSIIFISEGPRGPRLDIQPEIADVVRAANESNTAIYAMDPRGLGTARPADSLYELADSTGGRSIVNTNVLELPLGQIVREASAFYLLGYVSERNPADGRFHQIKVRVKRGGLEVRARKGYWAPSAEATERARAEAAAAELPPRIATALQALTGSSARRSVDVWTGFSRGEDGRPVIAVTWTPRAGQDVPAASVSVAARGQLRSYYDGAVTDRGVSFPVEPGNVQLQISVSDAHGEIIDTETRIVDVPDPSAAPMVLGTPILLRARNALELRALAATPSPTPYAAREFSRTDRILIRCALFGDPGGEATLAARLMTRRGTPLTALPIAPVPGRSGIYQIDLTASALAPGDFLVGIDASRGADRAEAIVAIRITGS